MLTFFAHIRLVLVGVLFSVLRVDNSIRRQPMRLVFAPIVCSVAIRVDGLEER